MKAFLKRELVLAAILMSCSATSGWSSQQMIWEDKEDARTQVADVRKNHYSVQLSSFVIPSEKRGVDVASEELDRLTRVAKEKDYDLTKHVLFSVKAKSNSHAYCAMGAFDQKKDAELLSSYLGTIFPSSPLIKEPSDISNVPLDFVVYRPKIV